MVGAGRLYLAYQKVLLPLLNLINVTLFSLSKVTDDIHDVAHEGLGLAGSALNGADQLLHAAVQVGLHPLSTGLAAVASIGEAAQERVALTGTIWVFAVLLAMKAFWKPSYIARR